MKIKYKKQEYELKPFTANVNTFKLLQLAAQASTLPTSKSNSNKLIELSSTISLLIFEEIVNNLMAQDIDQEIAECIATKIVVGANKSDKGAKRFNNVFKYILEASIDEDDDEDDDDI